MTPDQITQLIRDKAVPHPTGELRLVETHISWVLLGDGHVYKIKKPLALNFLDFSDVPKRRANCEREVLLNRRLAPQMYLGVLPVMLTENGPEIRMAEAPESGRGAERASMAGVMGEMEIIDHAVWMRRMDESRQLDILLGSGEVSIPAMEALAGVLATFHRGAPIIHEAEDWEAIHEEFRDLDSVTRTLGDILEKGDGDRIRMVIANSWKFLRGLAGRIEQRKAAGFVRDGHGDLHCRNILMTDPPVVFDCIEFSDSLRTLDVLSEIGFLCMDLERFGRPDLSAAFRKAYERAYPCMENEADRQLFTFYKMYRANVRMKVETLALEWSEKRAARTDAAPVSQLKGYARAFFTYAQELDLLSG